MIQTHAIRSAEPGLLEPPKPAASLEVAIQLVQAGGLDLALDTFGAALQTPMELSQNELNTALVQLIIALNQSFQSNSRSPAAYRLLNRLDSQLASKSADLFVLGCFPGGEGDPSVLSDAAILCCGGLLSAAGRHKAAVDLLARRSAHRGEAGLQHALFRACCRWTKVSHEIASNLPEWDDDAPKGTEPNILAEAADEAPYDVSIRRRLARRLIETGAVEQGLDQLATALALPLEDDAKLDLAEELGWLLPVLIASGDEALVQRSRFRWAVSACPGVISQAEVLIRAASAAGELPFLDSASAQRIEAYLESVTPSPAVAPEVMAPDLKLSPFPTRGGRPHVDTVWLEITNFCNQKCTFCPDPFARSLEPGCPSQRSSAASTS